jgi:hypothetical protein
VLSGRCFEQESVPYKMLDGLVDALYRYLRRMPRAELTALLPQEFGALARLCPVLGQLPEAPVETRAETGDPAQLRRRGAWALRELLTGLTTGSGIRAMTLGEYQRAETLMREGTALLGIWTSRASSGPRVCGSLESSGS